MAAPPASPTGMTTPTLNIAIVGLGWWGRTLLDLASTSAKLRVVRVADVNPQARARAGKSTRSSAERPAGDPGVGWAPVTS